MPSLQSFYASGVQASEEWKALLATDCKSTLAEVQSKFETQTNIAGENATLTQLHGKVRTVLETAAQSIQEISLYVSLKVPIMEDGNNFGVTVQLQILKELKDALDKIEGKLDELPSYFAKRADAVDKLGIPSTSTTETKTSTSSDSSNTKSGGEKEGSEKEEKSAESTTQETKTTSTTHSAAQLWRQQHVVSLDVAHYAQLKRALTYTVHSYVILLDLVDKNQSKLEMPKGSDEGRGFSSMY